MTPFVHESRCPWWRDGWLTPGFVLWPDANAYDWESRDARHVATLTPRSEYL